MRFYTWVIKVQSRLRAMETDSLKNCAYGTKLDGKQHWYALIQEVLQKENVDKGFEKGFELTLSDQTGDSVGRNSFLKYTDLMSISSSISRSSGLCFCLTVGDGGCYDGNEP